MLKHHTTLELDCIIAEINKRTVLKHSYNLDEIKFLNDPAAIEKALAETDEASVLLQRMHRFPIYFRDDILFILKMIHKSRVISLPELTQIGKFLDTIEANYTYLESINDAKIEVVYFPEYIKRLTYPKQLNQRIKEIINPYGEINDDATAALRSVRRAIRDTEKNIQNKLQEFIGKNAAKLTQSTVSIRNERYVVPVKNEFKNTVNGIIHDISSSGESAFIEPLAVHQLNNRLNELHEEEEREIHNILKTVSRQIDSYYEELTADYEIIAALDLLFAKAEYGLAIGGSRPKVNNQGIFELINGRHPLLKTDNVVANSVTFGKYKGIIVTGPNTGGKTVLLKMVGLLSLMVKLGLLIPCDPESNLMIFDNVFADIGDEQSIDQNLSTFSGHLKNIIDIMKNVTDYSLVLLDELGSGTDPAEGTALAIAIFDYLLAKECMVIATSHYSELKVHAYNSDAIINASVEFDIETLQPTYKLLMGIPGQSNALKIARILGLEDAIIKAAENYTYRRDDKTEKVLAKLINQSHELDRQLKAASAKNQQLQTALTNLDMEKAEIDFQKAKILKAAEEEARKIITSSRNEIDRLIGDLETLKKREVKAHEIADIKHRFKKIKLAVQPEIEVTADYHFEPDMHVYLENFGAYGIILKENKNNNYEVQMGNVTVTVDKKYLRPGKEEKRQIRSHSRISNAKPFAINKHVTASLDLRGLRYEEARVKLEKYLDDVVYAGLTEVNIIHGYGTGVIREMVRKFIKSYPEVAGYRFGGAHEGGQGVTVITLKQY